MLLECANIALNLLMQQRQRLAAERTGKAQQPDADPVPAVAAVTVATAKAATSKDGHTAAGEVAADAGSIQQGNSRGSSSGESAKQGAGPPSSKRKEQPQAVDGEG